MFALIKKDKFQHYLATLKFALYCITHPLDGFWDLTHEKRGSYAAANTILILTLVIRIMKLRYTSFIFLTVYWEELNIFLYLASVVFPLALFVVGNWALTTLFDGKGTLKDIYMGSAYALTPYILIQLPMIVFSNYITYEEGAFYNYFLSFSMIWCAFLFLASVMQIHDFAFGKALLSIISIIVGMLVIVFLLVLFFSLLSDAVAYFVSLYKEISFRFY